MLHDPPIPLIRLWVESSGYRDVVRVQRFVPLSGKLTKWSPFIIHIHCSLEGQYYDIDSTIDRVEIILMKLNIDDIWFGCFKIFLILSINIDQ